jgi:hypothetical protein
MPGETDLSTLIASMTPTLDPRTFVWASVKQIPDDVKPVFAVKEDEGITIVVTTADAKLWGLETTFPCARITLSVESALEAVGLTAAFARVLTDQGITANVVAGYYHDHIFVPIERAADAMAALEALAAEERAAVEERAQ